MTEIYVVETRSLKIARAFEVYLACEPVYFASSLDRAEFWMQSQRPLDGERFYFCVFKTVMDGDDQFEMVGYYDMLGQKTTKDRCVEVILPQHAEGHTHTHEDSTTH